MDISEILRVFQEWHKQPVVQFWGCGGDPEGILDHFEIFVTIAFNGA